MPSPTARQSHIDRALTNVSIAYKNANYVGELIFPRVPVTKQSDKFFTFAKGDWFRSDAAARAPGTRARRGGYTLSSDSYLCLEKAESIEVPDELVDNSDDPLSPLVRASEYVSDQLLLAKEIDTLDTVFGTTWSASATPGTLWSSDTSDPLSDMETGIITVACAIGRPPNTGVIGRGLWRYLKNHPDIVDRVKYGSGTSPEDPARVSLQGVAALVGLERILLTDSVKNTALEGAADTIVFVAGNHMALLYVSPVASLMVPSAGYVFTYKANEVNRYRENQEHQDIIEARAAWDVKLTATDAGYLIKAAA